VTVVVVGAHGLLGSHLVAELTRRRLSHLAVSRTPGNHVAGVDLRSEADVDRLGSPLPGSGTGNLQVSGV
jgi:nucleoside-diphosphate-sugar epimerase